MKAKGIIILVVIVIALAVGSYFLYKYLTRDEVIEPEITPGSTIPSNQLGMREASPLILTQRAFTVSRKDTLKDALKLKLA